MLVKGFRWHKNANMCVSGRGPNRPNNLKEPTVFTNVDGPCCVGIPQSEFGVGPAPTPLPSPPEQGMRAPD